MTPEDMQALFDRQAYMIEKFWVRNMPDHMLENLYNLITNEYNKRQVKKNKESK